MKPRVGYPQSRHLSLFTDVTINGTRNDAPAVKINEYPPKCKYSYTWHREWDANGILLGISSFEKRVNPAVTVRQFK